MTRADNLLENERVGGDNTHPWDRPPTQAGIEDATIIRALFPE